MKFSTNVPYPNIFERASQEKYLEYKSWVKNVSKIFEFEATVAVIVKAFYWYQRYRSNQSAK